MTQSKDEALYQKGRKLWKAGRWSEAMELYMEAEKENPDSPAHEALAMATQILEFYNKDIYGQ